jgi:hypothetical protein
MHETVEICFSDKGVVVSSACPLPSQGERDSCAVKKANEVSFLRIYWSQPERSGLGNKESSSSRRAGLDTKADERNGSC